MRSGGRLVIMDAKVPPGPGGRFVLPFSVWLMKAHIARKSSYPARGRTSSKLTGRFDMEEFMFGSYYICRAVKP